MLCSNCKIIEILLEAKEAATCENGHMLCGKCMIQANNKCMLCEGRLFDNNTWKRRQANEGRNWTPDMIQDWTKRNEYSENASEESIGDDLGDLAEECDAVSMNLLYSRGEAYEADSVQHSDSVNLSDSKWNQPVMWNNLYPKGQPQHNENDPKCSKHIPKRYVKLGCREEPPPVVKKDTRQNLVEQTRAEIRKKIMEDISRSFNSDRRSHISPEEYAYIKKLRTVGVSTESTPRLLPEDQLHPSSVEHSRENMVRISPVDKLPFSAPLPPKEVIVMNVDTNTVPDPPISASLKKKANPSSVDVRLQEIMGTILESVTEKPTPLMTEDQHFYKFLREKFSHMPLRKLEEIISSIYEEGDNAIMTQVCPPCQGEITQKESMDTTLMSNSRRAFYNPPSENQPDIAPHPQFQLVSLCNVKINSELHPTGIIDAATLNIPRSPVICPISTCQRAFFVSDFTKHIAVDHTKVPMERIIPRQVKNFFLDPKLIHFGISRCQVLLLVKDKIMNLGHEKFKDFIPILVMTTKLSLIDICTSNHRLQSNETRNDAQSFIMIWLTGIMPPQLPIFFSLTVWARSGYRPACHIVHSGRLYSVRNSQSPDAVRRSGQMLLLSENQVNLLTNGGRHMLELQIAVH